MHGGHGLRLFWRQPPELRPGLRPRRPGQFTLSIGEPIIPAAGGWPEMVRLRGRARARLETQASAPTV